MSVPGVDDPEPVVVLDRWRTEVADAPIAPLDTAFAAVAAALGRPTGPADLRARLDGLADRTPEPTLTGVRRLLFDDAGLTGNDEDYYDPRNSFLDDVLDRGVGIPISLAAVMIEVGRRVGAPVSGIGLPGHFMVRDRVDADVFVDPFAGGEVLDREGCRLRLYERTGLSEPLDDTWFDPVGPLAYLTRVLANLVGCYRRRRDTLRLGRVLELRTVLGTAGREEHDAAARLLARRGRFRRAAAVHHRLADQLAAAAAPAEEVDAERSRAARLVARLN